MQRNAVWFNTNRCTKLIRYWKGIFIFLWSFISFATRQHKACRIQIVKTYVSGRFGSHGLRKSCLKTRLLYLAVWQLVSVGRGARFRFDRLLPLKFVCSFLVWYRWRHRSMAQSSRLQLVQICVYKWWPFTSYVWFVLLYLQRRQRE